MRLIDPSVFTVSCFVSFCIAWQRAKPCICLWAGFMDSRILKKLFLALVVKSNGGSDPVSDIPY